MPIFDTETAADYDGTLIAQQEALQRRRALLARQAAAAADSLGLEVKSPGQSTGWTSAVTGTPIAGQTLKTPTAALISPVIQQIGAGLNEYRLQNEEKQFASDVSKDAAARIAAMPEATPAVEYSATPTNAPSDTNPGGNFVQANVTPAQAAKEPSLRERLTWAMGLADNPNTAGLGQKYAADALINEPDRAATRTATAREKELDRQARIDAAKITAGKPLAGSWQDSGQVTRDGLKVFLNTTTGALQDANGRILRQGNTPPPPTQGVTPIAQPTPTQAPADNGIRPKPTPTPQHVQETLNTSAGMVDQVRDLRIRFTDDMTGLRATIAGNEDIPMGKLKGMPEGDQATAQWWGDARRVIGDLRKQLSGQSLTTSEKKYFDSTSVGPTTDPRIVREYLDRLEKQSTVGAARAQALAEPGAKLDSAGFVRDSAGNPVPGTESPFKVEVRGTSTSTAPTVVRRGTLNGRRVEKMSDGSTRYAD